MRALLLCFLFSLVGCLQVQAVMPNIQLMNDMTVALVEVDNKGDTHIYCTGTWISPDDVLTANHCVEADPLLKLLGVPSLPIKMQNESGKDFEGEVSKADSDRDLAVVHVKKAPKHPFAKLGASPEVGQRVFTTGHPLGLGWSYIPGYVSAVRPNPSSGFKNLQVAAMVTSGDSGAAYFNLDGEIVGVHQMSIGRDRMIKLGIHRDEIEAFLSSK